MHSLLYYSITLIYLRAILRSCVSVDTHDVLLIGEKTPKTNIPYIFTSLFYPPKEANFIDGMSVKAAIVTVHQREFIPAHDVNRLQS